MANVSTPVQKLLGVVRGEPGLQQKPLGIQESIKHHHLLDIYLHTPGTKVENGHT